MKRFLLVLVALFAISALFGSALAQRPATSDKDPRLFALEDLRPGMKGTARTVFSGTEPQEFGVEILGVLPGFPGPRQSAIIARLSGSQTLKRPASSPACLVRRSTLTVSLVGAIAFSFPFSKEPIAGITPIQQMIDIFEKGKVGETHRPRAPRLVSFAQLASTEWKPTLPKAGGHFNFADRAGLRRLASVAADGSADDSDCHAGRLRWHQPGIARDVCAATDGQRSASGFRRRWFGRNHATWRRRLRKR